MVKKQLKKSYYKILKFDENNQYGHALTKPLPTGCIKESDNISWEIFKTLLEKISLEDEIGHLYIVDILFDADKVTKRQLVYNEIYLPMIEK